MTNDAVTRRDATGDSLRASRVGAGVLGIQAVALVGFTVFYVVELLQGARHHSSTAPMSIVLFIVALAWLGLLGWGLWRGARWARTPTGVWLALLLPVSYGMFQSGVAWIGAAVLLSALVGLVAVVMAGRQAGHAG